MTTIKKNVTDDKLKTMLAEAQELLENDTRKLTQEFISFFPKELESVRRAEKLYRSRLGVGGRARTIALACNLLSKAVEETTEEKIDETL